MQHYWVLRTDPRTPSTPDHGVIPGGYADLIFNVGDQVSLSDSGGIFVAKAKSFAVGPFDRFRRFRAEGQLEFLGVRFRPGRAPFSPDLPLGEARNRAVPLDDIWEDQGRRAEIHALEFRLAQVSGITQRMACVARFLVKLLRDSKEPDAVITQALSLIAEAKGQLPVETLAAAVRISGRQLERKFTQHVGLSPKAFCRITRFRQAKFMLESMPGIRGCDLASACGYYDQTQLIREFRWFTGQTPMAMKESVGFFLYDSPRKCYPLNRRRDPLLSPISIG